jgi:hypothetical protein
VARLADEDMEEARVVMRRLLWSLNDESGGIGWGAPEALAEIMVRHRGLAEEYLHMLVSYLRPDGAEPFQDGNYLEHEGLQRGLLWGIGRVAAVRPNMLQEKGVADDLLLYLSSADPGVRGLAALALGHLQAAEHRRLLERLRDDPAQVRYYDNDRLRTLSVGELADRAIEEISIGEGA